MATPLPDLAALEGEFGAGKPDPRGAPPVEPPRPHATLRSLAELAERLRA